MHELIKPCNIHISKAFLILGGNIDIDWLDKILENEFNIYCADGAFNKVYGSNVRVRSVLGDLDSIDNALREQASCIHLPDQSYTDFEKAVVFLKEKYDKIIVYGASGGNVDHFLGNLSVAKKYRNEADIIFYDPQQYYFFLKNPTEISGVKGKIISIIPFPELESVVCKELQYPLDGDNLTFGSLISIRNFAVQDRISISYKRGCGLLIVEQ